MATLFEYLVSQAKWSRFGRSSWQFVRGLELNPVSAASLRCDSTNTYLCFHRNPPTVPILLSRHVAEDAFVEPDKPHGLRCDKGLIWTNDVVAEFTLIVAFKHHGERKASQHGVELHSLARHSVGLRPALSNY